jgi:hypothetical protein
VRSPSESLLYPIACIIVCVRVSSSSGEQVDEGVFLLNRRQRGIVGNASIKSVCVFVKLGVQSF